MSLRSNFETWNLRKDRITKRPILNLKKHDNDAADYSIKYDFGSWSENETSEKDRPNTKLNYNIQDQKKQYITMSCRGISSLRSKSLISVVMLKNKWYTYSYS